MDDDTKKIDKRIGNQFWKARSSHGRKPIFESPEQLWEVCQEYFQWVEDNPLMQSELVKFQGEATLAEVPKMRAMTISGLCIFLDIDMSTWENYREKVDKENPDKDFFRITTRVERIIYNQKFAGASADMLNANIIARDLGLSDKKEVKHKSPVPIKLTEDMTLEEMARAYEEKRKQLSE